MSLGTNTATHIAPAYEPATHGARFDDRKAIVRERQRLVITGVPERTWRRWESEGRVPARRELASGTTGWMKGELLDWLDSLPKREATHAA